MRPHRYISYLFIAWVILYSNPVLANKTKIDSLARLLVRDANDTLKAEHLNRLCWQYILNSNNDTAFYFGNASLRLLDSLLINSTRPLTIKKLYAEAYNNIGVVYDDRGNFLKAQENYLRSLQIGEEIGDKNNTANCLGNLGIVYDEQGDFTKALEYYTRAVKENKILGRKRNVAANLCNIGIVKKKQKNFASAVEYYLEALKMSNEINDTSLISVCYGNLGSSFYESKEYDKAFNYLKRSLKMNEGMKDLAGVARDLGNLGLVNIAENDFKSAFDNLYRSLAICYEINAPQNMDATYEALSQLYERSTIQLPDSEGGNILNIAQMRQRSLYYYKRHVAIRDTLFGEEVKKQLVRKEMNFELEKKEVENSKRAALAAQENARQKLLLWLVGAGSGLHARGRQWRDHHGGLLRPRPDWNRGPCRGIKHGSYHHLQRRPDDVYEERSGRGL